MISVNNALYNNSGYDTGRNFFTRMCWYFVNTLIFKSYLFPFNSLKIFLLIFFGAKVGLGVLIKPNVNIKYPWNLSIGDNTWIGEGVWIDNLVKVEIGSNVCISQGGMLLTGNHNYKKKSFDLMAETIVLKDGVWIGAKAIVCPGVVCHSNSMLSVGSVAIKDLKEYSIYQGNPATFIRTRDISL